METSPPAKILLIDGDPQYVYLMERYVDHCGFSLILAVCSADILNRVEQEKPGLIFISVANPETDYSNLFRTLKSSASSSKIPVVLCPVSETARQDWMFEAEECLIQPIMYSDFIRIVSDAGLDAHL